MSFMCRVRKVVTYKGQNVTTLSRSDVVLYIMRESFFVEIVKTLKIFNL